MPDNSTDRIRRLIKTARQSLDTLSSAMDSLEGELQVMEQEEPPLDYEALTGQDPEITFTQEEAEIMLLKMLLNVQEAAFLLGVKPAEVYRMISAGELPVCKLSPRTIRIPVKQFREYIEAAREDAAGSLPRGDSGGENGA